MKTLAILGVLLGASMVQGQNVVSIDGNATAPVPRLWTWTWEKNKDEFVTGSIETGFTPDVQIGLNRHGQMCFFQTWAEGRRVWVKECVHGLPAYRIGAGRINHAFGVVEVR